MTKDTPQTFSITVLMTVLLSTEEKTKINR